MLPQFKGNPATAASRPRVEPRRVTMPSRRTTRLKRLRKGTRILGRGSAHSVVDRCAMFSANSGDITKRRLVSRHGPVTVDSREDDGGRPNGRRSHL